MKKFTVFTLILTFLFTIAVPCQAGDEGMDIRILQSKRVFSEFNQYANHAIPPDVLRRARAIIIFPDLLKLGFLYAGRFGLGVVLSRDEISGEWSAPAFVRLSGGGFGLQAGAQWSELILVGRDSFHLEFFNGGPALGASASASFGPWGVHSEIGTGWQINSAMHWYSRNAGFFAALASEGTVLSYDEEANRAYYGPGAHARAILFSGAIKPSTTGQMLIDELKRHESMTYLPNDPRLIYKQGTDGYSQPGYQQNYQKPYNNQQTSYYPKQNPPAYYQKPETDPPYYYQKNYQTNYQPKNQQSSYSYPV